VEARRAEGLAQALLATELPRSWRHSVGVAGQADRLASAGGFDGDLLVVGWRSAACAVAMPAPVTTETGNACR
jgi:hypothetical protein